MSAEVPDPNKPAGPLPGRKLPLPIWFLIAGGGLLLGILLLLLLPPAAKDFYTVSEVWQAPARFDGQVIHLRGKAEYFEMMTLLLCEPPTCDCNKVTGLLYLEADPPTAYNNGITSNDHIRIEGVDCRGNECGITCRPIDPRAAQTYEFVGRVSLKYWNERPSEIFLTNVDFNASLQLVNGAWEPIPGGEFPNLSPTWTTMPDQKDIK